MNYYRCSKTELYRELKRRGYALRGHQDSLAETLQQDDERRGTAGTTITTTPSVPYTSLPSWKPPAEFGDATPLARLVDEYITHWTLNTFFPSLHLFFASGHSVHIEGSFLATSLVGLDAPLRHRLTSLTHEENGLLTRTIVPAKFQPTPSIRILEATVGVRTSVAVKEFARVESARPLTSIAEETHVVVGLRLQGMQEVGYVWARRPVALVGWEESMWGHVRVAGWRDDVPVPVVGFPQGEGKPGARVRVVKKGSMVARKVRVGKGAPEYIGLGEVCKSLGEFEDFEEAP